MYFAYENSNYDFDTNGEATVIERLGTKQFQTVLDVGANVGEWTHIAADAFPDAKIHSFEIASPTSALLAERFIGNKRVVINPFGLSDRECVVDVVYYPTNSGLTGIVEFPHDLPKEIIQGNVRVGDDYIKKNGIDYIDFLKTDTEGADHLVLKGFEKTFKRGGIGMVQFEYGFANSVCHFLLRDFYEFFSAHGYVVGKIYPSYVDFRNYKPEHEDFIGPNYLAVPRKREDLIEILSGLRA